jgi:subtilisin-like proprotein convertase family protein
MSFRSRVLAPALVATLSLLGAPAGAQTFSNPTAITIPASGAGTPYPSDILVSGIAGTVGTVTVTITGLTHTWPSDLDLLLVGPQGQNVLLMSDTGGSADVADVSITFDDAAASALTDAGPITTGSYRPTNLSGTVTDGFPQPAPPLSGATTLATFAGTQPNGLWSLYLLDDNAGDSGSLSGGWSITVPEPGAAASGAALLALAALAARRR